MAEEKPASGEAAAIEGGAYEIISERLRAQAKSLRGKVQALNTRRMEVFGGTEMSVSGNERIRTENNCVARDIAQVGPHLLFGYNVFIGLKRETRLDDVLSLQRFVPREDGGASFETVPPDASPWLHDPEFVKEFESLYRYYKDTRLVHLRTTSSKLLAVFQVGDSARDIKVFRWALSPGGEVRYLDNRGDEDYVFPPSQDFEWQATGRDDFTTGRHPHVNILDEVFVETVGGDLTIKIEDNTESGEGIYAEPVDDANQSLDDAEIQYAKVGTLILLRIKPFQEETTRYLVFNTRSHDVVRIDAIGRACVQLPEDHGIIFPGGYYLQSGETKTFEGDVSRDAAKMRFSRALKSPNGEDVLYVFYEQEAGTFVLLPYNLIRKEVSTPIRCNGYCTFEDGRMVVFKAEDAEPTRVHHMQIWQTAFMSDEAQAQVSATSEHAGSLLVKIGNADLVRGISDASSIARAIDSQEPSVQVYEDLIAGVGRAIDAYYWLDQDAEIGDLKTDLEAIRDTAELVIDEFEKVQSIRGASQKALADVDAEIHRYFDDIRPDIWTTVDAYVEAMARLRGFRGRLISLRDMRYIDLERIEGLEQEVIERYDQLGRDCVSYLLGDEALAPYHRRLEDLMRRIEAIEQARESEPLNEELGTMAEGLDLLTEVVGSLEIDDATARTQILEGVSEVFGLVNRTKATLTARRKELLDKEGVAEFGVQFKLFAQSVQSALAVCDTPEKTEEQLTKVMVQLEELESRFSEFDQFLGDLAAKREEVYEAFSSRKQALQDERQRRADNLSGAADRILAGVRRRAQGFKALDELNAWFSADAMVMKLRKIADELAELGEAVRSEELIGRLKASRDEAARALKDRTELFTEGDDVIRFGKHLFRVNTQNLELTLVQRRDGSDEAMFIHLTGTDFYERLDDPDLEAAREFWSQRLVSENERVYRGEFLAAQILMDAEAGREGLTMQRLREAHLAEEGERDLLTVVREYAAERYDEGYDRGLHDADAALILEKLVHLRDGAGLLRFGAAPRCLAVLFWAFEGDEALRSLLKRKGRSLGRLRESFSESPAAARFATELGEKIGEFCAAEGLHAGPEDLRMAGSYLAEELAAEETRFATSVEAQRLRETFIEQLEAEGLRVGFEADLAELLDGEVPDLRNAHALAHAWLESWLRDHGGDEAAEDPALPEAVALLVTERRIDRTVSAALTMVPVEGLLGQHPNISERRIELRLDEFLGRLTAYIQDGVPGFRAFRMLRGELLERERRRLRLAEFEPRVLSSFVRNKLINEVYLPMIGDNLAKQMGALGDDKRTDLMGLLLLISPPGYGKTTLMEYVANRLGLIFMKVNGPSLGHTVSSLDPSEAPNATAAQEVDKINLALEMGNNVLLYLDDIQHTNPELLQKFISLCDATRRIEGVWKGRTRTYDLRGKRFAVCMAGNPYTETGEKFRIPDMLANRADTYNLGDVLSGRGEAFSLSYLENSLTSNRILAPVATREQSDFYLMVRMAEGEEIPSSELKHGYGAAELEEIVSVIQRLKRCQEVLLAVNLAYIESAATDDRFRTEPPFKLQGSYRNMNKLAEKIVAVMNEAELEALIDDHYAGEAQTLTTGAETNVLKLRELRGVLTEEEAERWEAIKKDFARRQLMGGDEDDPATKVASVLGSVSQQIEAMGSALTQSSTSKALGELTGATDANTRALLEYVGRLEKAVTTLADSKMSLQVVNQAPSGLPDLLARQLLLIESILPPLLEAAEKTLDEDGQDAPTWKRVHDALELLKQMDAKALEKAQTRRAEVQPFKAKSAD